ncbi:MAG TPA: branched-chain amino acid ABC transporter ATP-binding protein/permease [Candidatus Nanopelagicaceae bacterium]|nr:branched-chain amino acid ABC transporter ATP-binding protein/permease [Candidatus Nanopelagicaceae bacterium]
MISLVRALFSGRRALVVIFVGVLILYPVIRPYDIYQQTILLLAFLLAVQSVSWNIISGYAGYISLGHSAFLGLGAYTAAIIAMHTGVNPILLAPIGGLVAVLAALVLGSIVLRRRSHAFVIITIALLLSAQAIVTNWKSLTNGSDGITLALPSWSRDIQAIPFYYLFLLLMLITVVFSAQIRKRKFGTALLAIREDEGKAAAIGVNTSFTKIVAFCCSAFFIGMAGAVYAYFITFLNPIGMFNILGSVMIVLAALIGGRGTLWGPVVGAIVLQIAGEAANVYGGGSDTRVLLLGITLVLVVLFMPKGLLPTFEAWWLRRHQVTVEFTNQIGALGKGRLEFQNKLKLPTPGAEPVTLLDVRGVSKSFGGLTAVNNADLRVQAGSITGLIGPNGSGKTTLFNLITGVMPPDKGEIWFDGKRIDRLKPWERGHRGLGRTFQVTRLFNSMSVLENVVAPLPDAAWRTLLSSAVSGHEADRARHLLDYVGLASFADQSVGTLSYGQRKLVELAQVLMMEPRLILLDEPASGINPSLVEKLAGVIRDLNSQGVSFLIVEHNIPMVLKLCDPVIVFSRGSAIAEGKPDDIRRDPLVLDAYLGDEWKEAPAAHLRPVTELRNIRGV